MRRAAGIGVAICAFSAPAFAQDNAQWATAAGLAAARAAAPTIVVGYMDSVRQPRGSRGVCPADGRVLMVERGRLRQGVERISVGVPCATLPRDAERGPAPLRRIPMRFLHSRTLARLYLDERGRLVDYEALRISPQPAPPGW